MKKLLSLIFVAALFACKKETINIWECQIQDNKVYVNSDTMPILKVKNEFNNDVVCNCKKIK